ncbi:MAG: hypothetical protein E6G10_03715 [Actinobacteria bacterium]|nr:MAG: hypothetical protein E6G10_03715 [Actinomycetota bacterium]
MTSEDRPPPRGEDAWKATKQRIAKRNEAAYARAREERAERDAADRARRLAAERREFAKLPRQPVRSPDAPRA